MRVHIIDHLYEDGKTVWRGNLDIIPRINEQVVINDNLNHVESVEWIFPKKNGKPYVRIELA